MLEKFKSKQILYPTVIMVLICLVVTAALAGTNMFTTDRINEINAKNEADSMKKVLKADEYTKKDINGKAYYEAKSGGKLSGYVFKMSEKGYGGTVSVMVGIDTELKVNAVEVLDVTSETPGLGQNTAKDDFKNQFVGKSETLTAEKFGTANGENQINAVASATISSRAVTKCINESLKLANEIAGKGGNSNTVNGGDKQ